MNGSIRLRQGGRFRILFTKMLLTEQHFCEQEKKSTTLPQAKPAFGPATRSELAALHNVCY